MSKVIEVKNREIKGYVLALGDKYWGIEYYADGYCRDCYGVVSNIEDVLIFDKTEKPKDDNGRSSNFIRDAVFIPVVDKYLRTIEFLGGGEQ